MVRHGEIASNVKRIYAGRSSEKLTEKGLVQAKEVSEKLKNYQVTAIYTSPIYRAVQTATIIREIIGLDFQIEDSFREIEMGPWEGLSEEEIAVSYPNEWHIWQTSPAELKLPGRETLEELLGRVLKGIQIIYQNSPDGTLVVISHVAIIRVLLLWHTKQTLNLYRTINVPNVGVFHLQINNLP